MSPSVTMLKCQWTPSCVGLVEVTTATMRATAMAFLEGTLLILWLLKSSPFLQMFSESWRVWCTHPVSGGSLLNLSWPCFFPWLVVYFLLWGEITVRLAMRIPGFSLLLTSWSITTSTSAPFSLLSENNQQWHIILKPGREKLLELVIEKKSKW